MLKSKTLLRVYAQMYNQIMRQLPIFGLPLACQLRYLFSPTRIETSWFRGLTGLQVPIRFLRKDRLYIPTNLLKSARSEHATTNLPSPSLEMLIVEPFGPSILRSEDKRIRIAGIEIPGFYQ